MEPSQALSYAQNHEDTHLLRAFAAQSSGFFIDIGAGHPVYDNVTLAFHLRGWRGITVEPNPWLDALTAAVRPGDVRVRALVGAEPGEATYYQVDDFHGLSTTIAGNADAARETYGKAATASTLPMTTLRDLCAAHAPAVIDVLKIDVEGAERAVLEGNDWSRFRPRTVMLEALEPVTLQPSWDGWEPYLLSQNYQFAFFDELNRYYVAAEHAMLAEALADAPPEERQPPQFRNLGPAADDAAHPDHALARHLTGLDPVRLPLLPLDEIAAHLRSSAGGAMADAAIRELTQDPGFRLACGRISASSAW